MKFSVSTRTLRSRLRDTDQPRGRTDIGRRPCSCRWCRTSSNDWPATVAVTISPLGLAYLQSNSIFGGYLLKISTSGGALNLKSDSSNGVVLMFVNMYSV